MSGGVDSSVSAILLKEAGYEVVGATMRLWEDETEKKGGCSSSAVQDARRVCDKLDIPHYIIDFKEEFKKCVIEDFIQGYENAKTPNPCIECNRHIKFELFFQKALELECDCIATGHYAKIEYSDEYQAYVLKKSQAKKKDQTYFLYGIPREMLSKILFPLENYEDKSQIREIAKKYELPIAEKPDSQEVCFIPDNQYTQFLKKYSKKTQKEGNIVMQDGTILGKHNGLMHYTIGQRKGLGIAYKEPLYVLKLKEETNEVIVGTEKELYKKQLIANELNFLVDPISFPIEAEVKIRYRAKEAKAILRKVEADKIEIELEEPQRAITPGQSVVFYKNDIVLGGGKIIS